MRQNMYKILIADDEATITTQLEERMKYMGYDVVGIASSGEEAIEMAKQLKPDIILMDIVMPGKLDGIEASKIIKNVLDIPVIFITAYADDSLIKKAIDVEPFGYIVKPFQEKEIKAVIDIGIYKKKIERELQESGKRFKELANLLPQTVFETDDKGKIIYANNTGFNLFGYTQKDVDNGINFSELFIKKDTVKINKLFPDIRKGKIIKDNEYTAIKKDGTKFPVQVFSSPIKKDNECIGFRGIVIDITARKRSEEALKKSEELYRLITENTSDVITLITFDLNAIYTYISPSIKTISGYEPEDLLGKSCFELIYPEDKKILFPLLKKYIGLKIKKFFTGNEKIVKEVLEYRIKDKSGNWRYAQSTANIVGDQLLFVSRDITEKKRIEKELRESEIKYRQLAETAKDVILLLDLKGNIKYVNQEGLRLSDYNENEALKININDVLPAKGLSDSYKLFSKRSAGDTGIFNYEIEFINKKGDKTPVEIKSSLITTNDKPSGVLIIARDITERKQIEVELTKYRKHLEELVKERTAELQESEKKYRTLFESSRDAIMMLAPPEWLFIAGNPATIKMIKAKDEKEFISKSPWELSPEYQPDGQLSSEKAIKMIERAMKTGSHFFEWTHKRLDGNDYPATVLLTRIELEGKKLLQATVRDITERKQAEEELKKYREHLEELVEDRTAEFMKSEEKYRTLAENMNVGLYRDTVGQKGNFIEINPALVKMFGYENREEVFRLNVSDLYQNPEDRNVFNQKILKTGFLKNEELNLKKKDGSTFICSVSAVAVRGENGKVKYYDGIIDDITERKRAEEELHKYADTQKVLLQEVNHRVKNNLTAILGLLNMEEAKTKPKDKLTFINELKGQIIGLSTVHSLLSESGWGPVNLNLLCEQIIRASLSCLPNSNLVVFNVSPTKIRVNSNQAHHLAIAINELITNSLKYGQNKKTEVLLKVDFTKNKENVTITYKDSGKGYPQKLIDGDYSNVGVGYDLIKGIVTQSLIGELKIYNDNGAAISISFKIGS